MEAVFARSCSRVRNRPQPFAVRREACAIGIRRRSVFLMDRGVHLETEVSFRSVDHKCAIEVSFRSVNQKCGFRSIAQICRSEVSVKSVAQKCRSEVSNRTVAWKLRSEVCSKVLLRGAAHCSDAQKCRSGSSVAACVWLRRVAQRRFQSVAQKCRSKPYPKCCSEVSRRSVSLKCCSAVSRRSVNSEVLLRSVAQKCR